MPALTTTQEIDSDWDSNIYVLTTTRVFVVIGTVYLIKSLYTLVLSVWGTGSAAVAVAAEDIGLEGIVSDTSVTVPEVAGPGPNLEVGPTLELHPPQPMYDPQYHSERAWANARAQSQSTEVSGQSAAAHTIPEREIGLHNGDPQVEEDMDITMSFIRHGEIHESVVGEEVDGDATRTSRTPRDAVGPSLDA